CRPDRRRPSASNAVTVRRTGLSADTVPLESARDSEHHLRLVWHAGGRPAGGMGGDEPRPGPGRAGRDDAGSVPSRVLPPVHPVLRAVYAACPDSAARGMVSWTVPRGPKLGRAAGARARVPGVLSSAPRAHVRFEHG